MSASGRRRRKQMRKVRLTKPIARKRCKMLRMLTVMIQNELIGWAMDLWNGEFYFHCFLFDLGGFFLFSV
jgi:hypothetical protein